MEDKEMLEWAAKAAGYKFDGNLVHDRYSCNVWNPLDSTDDAMRLADAREMIITVDCENKVSSAYSFGLSQGYSIDHEEDVTKTEEDCFLTEGS